MVFNLGFANGSLDVVKHNMKYSSEENLNRIHFWRVMTPKTTPYTLWTAMIQEPFDNLMLL